MSDDLKREIILENYQNPMNKQDSHNPDAIHVNGNNESCIDNVDLYVTFKDGKIENITFNGEACAISTASTSIMISKLIGKTMDEAINYIDSFEKMVNEEEYDKSILEEALVFDEIYKQKSRKTCATLPYTAFKKALNQYKND